MSFKVLIPQMIAEEGRKYLRDKGYEVISGSGHTEDIMIKEVADCEAMLVRTETISARVLEAGPKLRVIGRHGVGYDNIDVARATQLGIWVTFAPDSNADTVAENTMGLIICLARNFMRHNKEIRQGRWEIRNKLFGSDLAGKVLGLVGLGKIGSRVARKAARGFDMNVIAYDPFLKPEQFPEFVTPVKSRDDIFSSSDFISLHVPATQETKGSVTAREFGLMKKTAYLINAARGDIVKEADLIEALQKGVFAGAALDVYEKEPPAMDNPLLAMESVILTPHNSSHTRECMVRMALHAAQGIDEVLTGRRPTWPVNHPIGK